MIYLMNLSNSAFNIGIEAGQILFVGLLAAVLSMLRRLSQAAEPVARGAAVYLMGGMAVFSYPLPR